MNLNSRMNREITKKMESQQKLKKYCKHCNHTVIITYPKTFVICTWCGHNVYKSDADEFKHKMISLTRKR